MGSYGVYFMEIGMGDLRKLSLREKSIDNNNCIIIVEDKVLQMVPPPPLSPSWARRRRDSNANVRDLPQGSRAGQGDASQDGHWAHSIPIVATLLGALQLLLYLFSERLGIHSEVDVGVSWDNVVKRGEYWRLFVAHFFHFGRVHVVLNVISLYCFGRYLERKIQGFPLLLMLEAMGIGSNLIFILLNQHITRNPTDTSTCGFSHVHFGLRILLAYTQEPRNYEPSLFLGLYPAYLSPQWAPWQPLLEVSLLKLIIPELNVMGQVSGILVGFGLSFVLKLFRPHYIYTEQFVNARNWLRD